MHHVDHFVGDAQVLDVHALDVHLGHAPEAVTILAGADHLAQIDVHPIVTAHQVAIVGFTILQLHQHGMILRCSKQRQGQHSADINS